MARSPRHRALDALLHRLRQEPAAAVFRLLPQGPQERLGQAAQSTVADTPCRPLRRAPRERVAARKNPVGQALHGFGVPLELDSSNFLSIAFVLRFGRRADLPFRAGGEADRDHWSAGSEVVGLL